MQIQTDIMFPSMLCNPNPPPHYLLSPSLPNTSSPPTNQEKINQTILFHHQMQFTDHHFFLPNNHIFPLITEAPIDTGSPENGGKVSSSLRANKPMKKDRHSKIYTAQGLRDRRVRLSIEISRRFFDLQDMLGFDKASKTLDWLLTKSRKAIKDLAKAKCKGSSVLGLIDDGKGWSSSTCECDQAVSTRVEIARSGMVLMDDERSVLVGGYDHQELFKMVSSNRDGGLHVLPKESRAKARARARARTRAKMSNKNTRLDHNDQSKKLCPDSQVAIEDKKSNHPVQPQADHQTFSDHQGEVNVEQSALNNRKLKQSPVIINNYQKNLEIVGKDVICDNYNNSQFYNYDVTHQNWDINPAIAQSTFSSVTHMSFSSGIPVSGKQWAPPNSQSLL